MSELMINPGVELRNSQLELYHFRLRLAIAGGLVTRVPVYEMRFTPDLSFWRAMPRNGRREGDGVSL